MATINFKNGQPIFAEGSVTKGVYVIQTGRVVLTKKKGSELVEIGELNKGDFLGLASFCSDGKENTSAEAVGNVSLVTVPSEILEKIKGPKSQKVVARMLESLAVRLHAQNEKIKKYQYFDTLHFDKYKQDEMSLYHLKDILKLTWVLLLAFNRYNFSISREYYEDVCSILISNIKIKPERIISLYISTNVIVEDEKTGNLSLINAGKLEYFAQFMLQNFIKNPRKLLLNRPCRQLLERVIQIKNNKEIIMEDELGFHYSFRPQLVKACEAIPNATLCVERLVEKGFFRKEYDSSGQAKLSFEFETFEEILSCYKIIDKLIL